ncbi:MAG: hypothetical protein CMJ89_17560 [Planctomycetes bacterium]|nr:hypothetical protein [Planctomycetota bacterium]
MHTCPRGWGNGQVTRRPGNARYCCVVEEGPSIEPREQGSGKHGSRTTCLWLGAVLLATAAVYWRSLAGELVYDDVLLVGRNPYITDLSHIGTAFTRGYWDFLEVENAEKIGYWRPLTAISLTLVWHFFEESPAAFHAACVAVHLLATAIAFFLARRLTSSTWIGGFTALFFGLHPTHVESVAWISALNDPLFGVFCLLSLHAYLRWRDNGSRGLPVLAVVAFAFGLLAKELAAATILLIAVLDLGRCPAGTRRARPVRWQEAFQYPLRAYLPFVVTLGAYLAVRMAVFQTVWAGFERETTHFAVDAWREWLLRAEILGGTIQLLAFPFDLNLFRVFRPYVSLSDPKILAALASIAIFTAASVAAWKKRWRPGLFGLLLIPAGILPVLISIQSLGRFPLSDRFLYIPVFGFGLVLCLLLRRLPGPIAWIVALSISIGYGRKSYDRIAVWRNEETLFARTAEQSPRSVYAQWGLGRVYLERVRSTADPGYLTKAFAAFERASELLVEAKRSAPEPGSHRAEWRTDLMVTSQDFLQVNLGLAWCYIMQAQLDPTEGYATPIAILNELIRRVSDIEQQVHEARELGIQVLTDHLELEKLYTALGVAQRFGGDTEAAEESFRRALSLQPNYVEAHMNYGRLLAERQAFAQARGCFQKALELQPGDFETKLLLAQVLREEGQDKLAEQYAQELHALRPNAAKPMVILGSLRFARGEASEALTWFERATRADPRDGHTWYLKAKALIQRNATTQAISAFRNAVKWAPNFESNYDFGAYLLMSGAVEEALPLLVSAYELAPEEHIPALRRSLIDNPYHTADTLYRLGAVDLRRSQLDMAESFLNGALKLQPGHEGALLLMSRLLKIRGRHNEALDTLRIAASRMPQDFSVHLEFGLYLLDQGRFEESAAALVKARAIGPDTDWDPQMREDALSQIEGVLASIESGEARRAREESKVERADER